MKETFFAYVGYGISEHDLEEALVAANKNFDYLVYLQTVEPHEAFLQGNLASEAGSAEFTLTESFEEALELCRFGWHEGFGDSVALVERVKRNLDIKIDPNRTFHDYVEFAPDVKAYLEVSPLTMINKPVVRKPLVTIYI